MGSPCWGAPQQGAHGPQLERISRRQVTVPSSVLAHHAVVREGFRILQLEMPQQGHGLNRGIAFEDRKDDRLPRPLPAGRGRLRPRLGLR